MSDQQLQSMTEQEIRARFRCAPAYYLQAKLERKRALERRKHRRNPARRDPQTPAAPEPRPEPVPEPIRGLGAEPLTEPAPEPVAAPEAEPAPEPVAEAEAEPHTDLPVEPFSDSQLDPVIDHLAQDLAQDLAESPAEPESLDLALPGFEILDAALSEFDDRIGAPEPVVEVDMGLTQHAILEAALEDYGNWPFLSEPDTVGAAKVEPEVEAWFELEEIPQAEPATHASPEPKLELVREKPAEPKADSELEELLQQLLDSEPDLDLVLDADPELEAALASEAESAHLADNVTRGDFGKHGAPTVRVVSVAMDRKRPNMVRVVRESSRLAS